MDSQLEGASMMLAGTLISVTPDVLYKLHRSSVCLWDRPDRHTTKSSVHAKEQCPGHHDF